MVDASQQPSNGDWIDSNFRLAMEASPSGQIVADTNGTMLYVNGQLCRIFGYEADDLVGQQVEDLVPMRYRPGHPAMRDGYFSNPAVRAMGAGRDLFGLRRDGSEVPVEIGLNPFQVDGSPFVLASVVDISERKRLELERQELNEKMQQAQRLESLGVMAGGIAHDFNNILVAILGFADLSLTKLPSGSQLREYVHQIKSAGLRASDLTKQMLAYAGRARLEQTAIDCNALISELSGLLMATVSKKVDLHLQLGDELPRINGDAAQVQQVLMNLITNAAEAIGDDAGRITVQTMVRSIDEADFAAYSQLEPTRSGTYVVIEVADDGCGMSDEVRAKLFDPFFTTKFTGRGLGMASVIGILRGHGGGIRVVSEEGRGSTFTVVLPAIVDDDASGGGRQSVDGRRQRWQVLVIDDEGDVRHTFQHLLDSCGCDCLHARDGAEGIEIFRSHQDQVDLVFLDMNMPRMHGSEVYPILRAERPDLPIVLMSGYEQRDATMALADEADALFMQKPFQLSTIVATLERCGLSS